MFRRVVAATVVLGLGLRGATAADEVITIKVKKAAKGDVIKESKSDENTDTSTVVVGGQTVKQEDKASNKAVFVDEILEADGKAVKPTKLKRTYETAEAVRRGQPVDLGLAGKTVLIEKTDKKYAYTVDGQPVGKAAADVLDREFNRPGMAGFEEVMLPKKPVKVGDTWAGDVAEVTKLVEALMTLDAGKTKVTGKLLKVYDKGGAKYGVIEYTLTLAVTGLSIPTGKSDAAAGSAMTFTITTDGCIDGSVYGGTAKGTVTGNISGLKVPIQGQTADLSVTTNGVMNATSGLSKK